MKNFVPVALTVIRNSKGKFLVTQRWSPEYPDVHLKWQLPGGGIEYGENSEDTAKREALEEVGHEVKFVFPYPVVKKHLWHHKSVDPYHAIIIVYLCELIDETKPVVLDAESHSFAWHTLEEIKKLDALPDTATFVEELVALAEQLKK